MKKALLLGTAALLGLLTPANAAERLTRANAASKIVDGAVIALQCKDTNGGLNSFFSGDCQKVNTMTTKQLWKVIGTQDGKFMLQRLSDSQYVSNGSGTVTMTASTDNAAKFTVTGATLTGWTTKPSTVDPNTAPTIRFVRSDNNFLNTHNSANTPQWTTGTGGYSGWYVYLMTDADVAHVVEYSKDDYVPTVLSQLENHNIVRRNFADTEIDSDDAGWYMIYNRNNGKYLKQQGKDLVFENVAAASSDFENGGSAVENAGYLFRIRTARHSDYSEDPGTNYLNIQSGYGDYVALLGSGQTGDARFDGLASQVSFFPRSFAIDPAPGDDNTQFILKDKVVFKKANVTGGTKLCAYQSDSYYDDATHTLDPNDAFEFFPVNLTEEGEQIVTFNVKLTYQGETFRLRQDLTGIAGQEFRVSVPAFFADGDDQGTVPVTCPDTDGVTVEIQLTQPSMPFKASESIDNMYWQAVRQHCGALMNSNYVWNYAGDAESTRNIHQLAANASMEGFTDSELWAFVGDYINGFKIYNKAAGTEVYLYQGESGLQIGTVAEADAAKALWRPFVTNNTQDYYWDMYCTFRSMANKDEATAKYINLQSAQSDGTANMTYWSGADQGSTVWFLAPSDLMLDHASDYNFEQRPIHKHDDLDVAPVISQVPEYAVGAYDFPDDWEYLATGQGIIDAAIEDPYDLDKAAALKALIAAWEENVIEHEFNYNNFYRILNAQHGQYIRTNSDNNNIVGVGLDGINKDYHSIMQFVPCEDGDHYFIKSQGLYFGKVNGSAAVQQVESTDEAAQFEAYDPANHDRSIFVFGDISSTEQSLDQNPKVCLHLANPNSNVSGWGTGAAGSHFLLVQAIDVDVDLPHTIAQKKVGFGYFPFAVSAASEGTSLNYLHEQSGVFTTTTVSVVPANTPFMVISTSEEVTLNIVSSTPARVQAREGEEMPHVMSGTLRPTTAQEGDYVIGTMTQEPNVGKIGLVKATSETAVAGNSIYVPAASLSDVAKESDELPLEDVVTTGISAIAADATGSVKVYDLQGRRLAAPAKGINIINGTKVLIK